jgi:MFS family permease
MPYHWPVIAGARQRIAEVAAVAPRAYWYVWWGTLINRLGGFVVPLLTIYLIGRGVSVSEAGGVVSVYGAGSIAASLVGGYLADHFGRKRTLLLSLFGGAIAMTGLGLARELPAITVMVGVVGFVGELYRPAVAAIVADVVPPAHRVQAYALLHWVINIGFAVAVIIGGLLATVDFTILFIGDAATMAIYGVIVWVAVPETRPTVVARAEEQPSRSWITDGAFVAFVVIVFAMALMPFQSSAPLAAHMTWQAFSPAAFGAVMSINGILIIVLQPTVSAWAARREPTRVLVAAALFYGVGFAIHGFAASIAIHALAVMVWTMGEILESGTRAALVAAMAPADARGRYQGALSMTFGAAQLVGPKLGTWVWESEGPSVLWGGCLVLGVVVALALIATAPGRNRRIVEGLRIA